MTELDDSERHAVRYLLKHSISRSAILGLLINCRTLRFTMHLNDYQYADTLKQSAQTLVKLDKAVLEEVIINS